MFSFARSIMENSVVADDNALVLHDTKEFGPK
jgi:hypothetical protein